MSDKATAPTSSTIPTFCKRHSLTVDTFYRLAREGKMPRTTNFGHRMTRIRDVDEQEWLATLPPSDPSLSVRIKEAS